MTISPSAPSTPSTGTYWCGVRLEGEVKAWYERDIIERPAWAAPGVKSVEDHVVVSP